MGDPELKLHLRFALNQCWTEGALSEALLTAIETFKEIAAE